MTFIPKPKVVGVIDEDARNLAESAILKNAGFRNLSESGVSVDGTNQTAALQAAIDSAAANGERLHSGFDGVILIDQTITIPAGLKGISLPNVTLMQENSANLDAVVSVQGFANEYCDIELRIDGNRQNNDNDVVGISIDGTTAGGRCRFDLSLINCDTGYFSTKEVEHVEVKIYAKDCGIACHVTSDGVSDSDENNYLIYFYQVNTAFKADGDNKTSGSVELHGETTYSWVVDLEHGYYTFSGFVRSGAMNDGGGIRVSGSTAKVHLSGLTLILKNSLGSWAFLCDANCFLSGTMLGGGCDGGAWLKRCAAGSSIDFRFSAPFENMPALVLGSISESISCSDARVRFTGRTLSNAVPAFVYELGQRMLLHIDECYSEYDYTGDILSGAEYSNITLSRHVANEPFRNANLSHNNVIVCEGSYTQIDTDSICGGNPFNGYRVDSLRGANSNFSGAYYSSAGGEFFRDSQVISTGEFVIDAGANSQTVIHGARAGGSTSYKVMLIARSSLGNVTNHWISSQVSESFTVTCDVVPAADINFDYVLLKK
ncbi:MAG: hypothetical protein CML13_15985 [Puniceicoccaceae bacterium]|nr:hypothetical protein [Puniceicoccaceae bacterium]|tara:strand:+ start:11996 stop:13630 length:1635 start_codon:yes stop_codon:yes gene_type:complete